MISKIIEKVFKIEKNRGQAGMTHSIFTQGHPEYSRGMTYIEVLTVLAIFFIMTSVVLFNYREFQAKVDIKNLASDIALKVVEAQKTSLDGKIPPLTHLPADSFKWNPSYGLYFDTSTSVLQKQFIYFTDLNDNSVPLYSPLYNGSTSSCTVECLDLITITKNKYISRIDNYSGATCSSPSPINTLTILFKRPDYSTIFPGITVTCYIQITVASPSPVATAVIKIYPSGRIQVN